MNNFSSYTDEALLSYNTAVTKLWLAGDDSFIPNVKASGAEMTARKLW